MLFQSYIFILLFFPLCLLGFWGLKRQKLLQLWLIAFSLWFYGAASPYYLLLLLGSIAWNYAFFRAIERGIGRVTERVSGSAMERAEYGMERDSSRKKLLLGIGIAGNLALLCFFKYFNAISAGWSQMKGLEDPILQLALPLGISFFTFQQIGFLADAYKGEVGACSLREYVLFVSFFPYVSSGPIVNAQEMLPQYRQIGRQRLDWAKFSGGLYLFALGLSKKVLLADTFGKAVDAGYGIELDVQMTADGKVVVVHDFNLKRISGVDKEIDQCTYEELQEYPIYGSDQRVPLFEDVLKAVDGKVPLIVELKYKEGSKICEKAQEILNGYTGIYCIESFHPQVLVWYRKNYPHICRGQLSMNFERDENTKGAQYFALRHLLTNFLAKPDFIAYDCRAMHAVSKNICRNLFGCPSVAWTVKCQAQLDACSRSFDYFIFEGFAPKQ